MKKFLFSFLFTVLLFSVSFAAQMPAISTSASMSPVLGTFETVSGGVSKYVPYTGATGSATLGSYTLDAGKVRAGTFEGTGGGSINGTLGLGALNVSTNATADSISVREVIGSQIITAPTIEATTHWSTVETHFPALTIPDGTSAFRDVGNNSLITFEAPYSGRYRVTFEFQHTFVGAPTGQLICDDYFRIYDGQTEIAKKSSQFQIRTNASADNHVYSVPIILTGEIYVPRGQSCTVRLQSVQGNVSAMASDTISAGGTGATLDQGLRMRVEKI